LNVARRAADATRFGTMPFRLDGSLPDQPASFDARRWRDRHGL
jgi:hypothetical protein